MKETSIRFLHLEPTSNPFIIPSTIFHISCQELLFDWPYTTVQSSETMRKTEKCKKLDIVLLFSPSKSHPILPCLDTRYLHEYPSSVVFKLPFEFWLTKNQHLPIMTTFTRKSYLETFTILVQHFTNDTLRLLIDPKRNK